MRTRRRTASPASFNAIARTTGWLRTSTYEHIGGARFTSVLAGDATSLPFAEGQFDIVLATDTIEHIDDDRKALQEIHRILVPGGYAMIAVPAFASLWGLQDVVAHHKRRYRTADLTEKIQSSGLEIQQVYYFNYLLFVPIWFARQVIKMLRIKRASEASSIRLLLINCCSGRLRLTFARATDPSAIWSIDPGDWTKDEQA